jgi:hypothetical protein
MDLRPTTRRLYLSLVNVETRSPPVPATPHRRPASGETAPSPLAKRAATARGEVPSAAIIIWLRPMGPLVVANKEGERWGGSRDGVGGGGAPLVA